MKTCDLCEKGSKMVGNRKLLRGHYNPTNWTRKYPNLQKATTPDGKRVLACAKCIRGFGKADRLVANRANRAEAVRLRTEKAKAATEANRAKQIKANEAKKAKANKKEEKKTGEKPGKKTTKKTTK